MSSNRSTQQPPGTSAISQINQLKPIPGIDDAPEDPTQRPIGESNRQPISMMKDVDPKSTRHKPLSPVLRGTSSASTVKDINQSQVGSVMGNNSIMGNNSVMGNNSTMGSVIKPLDLDQHHKQQREESSDNSTIFVKTKAVSRPAIVKEQNNWVKKQNVDMTRALPLGIQPGDVDAKKLMHSHTGVPSRINSNTAVSAAPASSPTPIQPFPDVTTSKERHHSGKNKSNEISDPSAKQHFEPRRKPSQQQQTAREKKPGHHARTQKSSTPPPPSKSAPNSPNAPTSGATASTSMSQSKSHGKESFFSKFTKNLLPSSSSTQPNPTAPPALPPKSKSATSIYERRKSKPNEKK